MLEVVHRYRHEDEEWAVLGHTGMLVAEKKILLVCCMYTALMSLVLELEAELHKGQLNAELEEALHMGQWRQVLVCQVVCCTHLKNEDGVKEESVNKDRWLEMAEERFVEWELMDV